MDGANLSSVSQDERDVAGALAVVQALDAPFAVIEFTEKGDVLRANQNFLGAMGFDSEDEIVGQHHRNFLFPEDAAAGSYANFWNKLAAGNFVSAEVRRKRKDGVEIWLSANYVPIRSSDGTIRRVRKYALDVTVRHDAVDLLLDALRSLAEGNILVRLDDRVRGDFSYVRDEFNALMDGLEGRMRRMMASTANITEVFERTSETANELQTRAELQAQEIQSTVSKIGEISERTRENSKVAEQADSLTRNAVAQAKKGAEIVRETANATNRIESITSDVAKITKVIENFAFQTNLLSINAAVEAARAGEAGRGFAVVAGEVRSLAQRSAEASKDIANLTRQSEEEVAKGAELARAAGLALEEIGVGVAKMNESVGKIAEASTQQARSVEDIEDMLRNMNDSVDNVSRLAKNGRDSSDMLANELRRLEEQTSHFSSRSPENGPPLPPSKERRSRR